MNGRDVPPPGLFNRRTKLVSPPEWLSWATHLWRGRRVVPEGRFAKLCKQTDRPKFWRHRTSPYGRSMRLWLSKISRTTLFQKVCVHLSSLQMLRGLFQNISDYPATVRLAPTILTFSNRITILHHDVTNQPGGGCN